MENLGKIQDFLQTVYEVNVDHRVEHFVTTDAALAHALEPADSARNIPEKLLVHQTEDDLDVALYFEEKLMSQFGAADPRELIAARHYETYWTFVEGVSHFLYLVWNASNGRGVSLLELELQAEVDKYIAALLQGEDIANPNEQSRLHSLLFRRIRFDESLEGDALQRYVDANHYASLYCESLQTKLSATASPDSLTNELRRFYRLSHQQKIDHILGRRRP